MTFIPLVNGAGGEVLSLSTWKTLGFTTLAYRLFPFLVKPGIEVLLTYSSLAEYVGWTGRIILDLSGLDNIDRDIVITSPFDGSKIACSKQQITELIDKLNTDKSDSSDIICDEPIRLAINGSFLDGTNPQSITDSSYEFDYSLLSEECVCPSCTLKLSKAYLHHLWEQVPGLCLRYLVQHNVYLRHFGT